ncbi:hypothetical protein F2Q70_00020573 [Brassica cretica]|nr:hypothetical protein F2Q70_00020573 [Brassica cretica]
MTVENDDSMRILIDIPFSPSIDATMQLSIDVLSSKLCKQVVTVLQRVTWDNSQMSLVDLEKVSIDDSMRISIDTPFIPSIDATMESSIDVPSSTLCEQV